MTVQELIDTLQQMVESDPMAADHEVRIAHQPSYPFELSIQSVEIVDLREDDDEGQVPVVYITEESQIGYLPGAAASQFGWR